MRNQCALFDRRQVSIEEKTVNIFEDTYYDIGKIKVNLDNIDLNEFIFDIKNVDVINLIKKYIVKKDIDLYIVEIR